MRGTTEMRPFSVFLEWGMMCPHCHLDDQLQILVMTPAMLGEGGTEADGDHEWNDESHCSCGHCGWTGEVSGTKPKYDPLITAMVIWEAVLESGLDMGEFGGACEARDQFSKMVPEVENAYNYASTLGYDAPFDWEFVPWLINFITTEAQLPVNWPDLVWETRQT